MKSEIKIKSKLKSVKQTTSSSYPALRTAVRNAIQKGKERATAAVEREKVRTSWEIGQLILEHVLLKATRADYGAEVAQKLSADLSLSLTEIHSFIEFARTYPILPTSGELSWSHFRELLGVNEASIRQSIEQDARSKKWTVKQLRSEIQKLKSKDKRPSEREVFTSIKQGSLDVFRTRVVDAKTMIDLGFSTYTDPSEAKEKYKLVDDQIFTYRAKIEDVVDGDTLWCVVDLGWGVQTRQKLRLRGLNAAEMISESGQKAKRYLKSKLPKGKAFILTTSKSDKFDRYLADIWVGEVYLNELLVRKGYAQGI
jgi:endonuclease YncB( thermonuclease family)